MARKTITKSKPANKQLVKKYQFAGANSSTYQQVANPYYISGTYSEQAALEAEKAYEEATKLGNYAEAQAIKIDLDNKKRKLAEDKALNDLKQETAAQNQQELDATATNALATGTELTTSYLKKRAAERTAAKTAEKAGLFGLNAASSTVQVLPTLAPRALSPTVGTIATQGVQSGLTLSKPAISVGSGTFASQMGTVGGKAGEQVATKAASTGSSIGAGLATAGVGLALDVGGTYLAKSKDDNDPTTFSDIERKRLRAGTAMQYAGKGVGIGGTIGSFIPIPGATLIGAGIGGLIGGAIGLRKGKKKAKEAQEIADDYAEDKATSDKLLAEAEAKRVAALNEQGRLIARSANMGFIGSRLQGFNTGFGYNTSTNMNTQPTSYFNKETGGVRKVPGGKIVPIPNSNAVEFIGNKHGESGQGSDSGIKIDPITEVEHKETQQPVMMARSGGKNQMNDYFFSAYLKLGGKSFAQRHKEILKSGGSQANIQQLAQMQELVASKKEPNRGPEQIAPPEQVAAYGGIHKYRMAGPEESAMAQSNMDAANVTLRDTNQVNAMAPVDQQSAAPGKRTTNSGMVTEYDKGGPKSTNISMTEWNKMNKDDRYNLIYNLAKNAGDKFPEVTAAQWAIESDFGKTMTGRWNAFGQTTKSKNATNLETPRDPSKGSKNFANYKSLEDSVTDHIRRWAPKYKDAKNPEEALMMLQNYGGKGRYAEGYPTAEFPEGDWKAYVTNTNKIIKQQQDKVKPVTEKKYPPRPIEPPLPSGAVKSVLGPIDYALLGLGRAIASGASGLAGAAAGAWEGFAGNVFAPEASAARPAASAPSMARRGPLRIEPTTQVGFPKGNQFWTNEGTGAYGPARGLLGEPVINVAGRTVKPMQALPEFKIGLGNPSSKINTQMFRQYDLDSAKALKAAEFVPTKSTIDPATGQTIEVVDPTTMGPFDVPVVVDEKAIEETKTDEQKKTDEVIKKEDAEREKTKPPRNNSLNTAVIAGLAQLAPLAFAGKYKTEGNLPRMKSPGKVGAGSVKGAIMPRVNMNAERASATANTVAIKNAIQNTNAGPGGIAAMMAANTAQNNQMLAIANQEQNANKQLSAEEARLGQQASQFNVETGLRAGMANMQSQMAVDQANLEAGMQEAKLKIDEKRYKREDKLARLDNFATRAAGIYKDYMSNKAQERLAEAMDDTGGYERFKYYEDLKKESKNKDSEFYGKTDAELKKYASQQWLDYAGTAKTGGARNRRYTSRLGELSKSKKTFNI